MKNKKITAELEVDIIGEQDSLTEVEEKALSEYFQKKKATKRRVSKSKQNSEK